MGAAPSFGTEPGGAEAALRRQQRAAGGLHAHQRERGIGDLDPSETWARLVDDLLSKHVEPKLERPTFVLDFPVDPSPLVRDHRTEAGVVEKSGSWFSYGDERIGQGRENAKQFLKDHPDVANSIEDKIRAAHGLDFSVSAEGHDEDGDLVEM